MKRKRKNINRRKSTPSKSSAKLKWLTTAMVVGLCTLFIYMARHPSAQHVEGARAVVEVRQYWLVCVGGVPRLCFSYFAENGSCQGIATHLDSVVPSVHRLTAVWCHRLPMVEWSRGRLFTIDTLHSPFNPDATALVAAERVRIDSALKAMNHEDDELRYYLRVHDVQDEGYNMIADYHTALRHRMTVYRQALDTLQSIPSDMRPTLHLVSNYYVVHADSANGQRMEPCQLLSARKGKLRLQTLGRQLPEGATSIWPWGAATDSLVGIVVQHPLLADTLPLHGVHAYKAPDGSYYEGDWENGQRNGFGFSIKADKMRVGEWKADKYLGERLVYSTQRIYGIDISRYQHEIGRRRYGIQWNRLRINHLGTISEKRIDGNVDFPVSFVYIKSTEGTTIRNAYFSNDYAQARRHGIRTGAYHFFSVRSTGEAQAQHFLRHTRFDKGDLPPVLDVEPSNAQINDMGGDSIMFTHIRTWLKTVERAVGVRPILYVNQKFVNNHLSLFPDIKRDYQVWIARYGEYKPDVRLSIWQLCPDGRVTGIQGHVDINVFNGYQSEFEHFLENATIK